MAKSYLDLPPAYGSQPMTSLSTAALNSTVQAALNRWRKAVGPEFDGVLIGGIALSLRTRPRMTMDVDFLFRANYLIPDEVVGFKRSRKGAFQDNKDHVEIEVIAPETVNLPKALVDRVYSTSTRSEGLRVASVEGLIALKLHSAEVPKRRHQDSADLQSLIKSHPDVDMGDWTLSNSQLAMFNDLRILALEP